MNRTIRFSVRTVTVVAGIAAFAYGSLLLINLSDAEPSELTQELNRSYESYPVPEDAENAYLVVLGFSALQEDDPLAMGIVRRDWMQNAGPEFGSSDDPLLIDYQPRSERPEEVNVLAETCKDPGLTCVAALDNSEKTVEEWRESEGWLLQRYMRLISMSAFLERGSLDVAAPLPPYHVVLEGQKLLFLETLAASRSGDTDKVRELLAQDLAFWRSVLSQSDLLITKMIATVAVAKHFKFGNLALRGLPQEEAQSALPDSWLDPITLDERSMKRCFAGEWMFSEAITRDYLESSISPFSSNYYAEEEKLWEVVRWSLVKPLWQPQDTSNRYAELLADMAAEIDGPLEEMPYSLGKATAIADSAFEPMSSAYNITGNFLSEGNGMTLPGYAARVADLEGIRRAAVLLASLRFDGVTISEVPNEIAASAINNPYTGLAFSWDESEKVIIFQGLEKHERGMHHIPY